MAEHQDIKGQLLKMKKVIKRVKKDVRKDLRQAVNDLYERTPKSEHKSPDTKAAVKKLRNQEDFVRITGEFELSSLCFIAKRDPRAVLANPMSRTDEIAIAHIRQKPAVIEYVDRIKTKLRLRDDDDSWRHATFEIGKVKHIKKMKANYDIEMF